MSDEKKSLRMTMEVGEMKGDPNDEQEFVAEDKELNIFLNGWEEDFDEHELQHVVRTAINQLFGLKQKRRK